MTRILKYLLLFSSSLALLMSCAKEYSKEYPSIPSGNAAKGELTDSLGNCRPITIRGNYYNAVTINSDSNYADLFVHVTNKGNYHVQSDRQNGFQFIGTGSFTDTGIQAITLKATGKPVQIKLTNFKVSFSGTNCGFAVNVMDSATRNGTDSSIDTAGVALNTWQFVANQMLYSGDINVALLTNPYAAARGRNLIMTGPVSSGSPDTAIGISIQFPGNEVSTGNFYTSEAGTGFLLHTLPVYNVIFTANSQNHTPVLKISVTAYNQNTSIVSGIFSGFTANLLGDSVQITRGKFKARLQ